MRIIQIIVIPLLVFSYLYLSYIRFYHFIGDVNLKSPYSEKSFELINTSGAGSVKYVALGDSLTAGVGSVDVESTFVYLYAQMLSAQYAKVKVLNLGLPGAMTEEVINSQIPLAIVENPNQITLLIGVNDIHNKVTDQEFEDKYLQMLNELLAKTNAKITVMNIPYLGADKIVYPPYNLLLDSRTKEFNKIIDDVVKKMDDSSRIKLINLYEGTYSVSKQDSWYYSSDLFHPSGQGYALWGEIINAY